MPTLAVASTGFESVLGHNIVSIFLFEWEMAEHQSQVVVTSLPNFRNP